MTSSRRLRRILLSALAGTGLTAAGLGGPLAGAIAAETTTPSEPTPGSTTPSGATETTSPPTPPPAPANTTSTATTPPPGPAQTQTTPAPSATPTEAGAPVVKQQRTQKTTSGEEQGEQTQTQAASPTRTAPASRGVAPSPGPSNVAPAPQVIAAQSGALSALLGVSGASTQSLQFFQVPLFLLPIYQSAATQYGVPWEILAAINEVETDYGADLSVSSAGAVGWMQFMPETWLQYGVDALDAGYADPYNPVDAIFAAARYLRAAGAAKDLRQAVFAYNHSDAYVNSVLLRARLLASYPPAVINTLTGLTDGRLPISGGELPTANLEGALSKSSPTAGASFLGSAPAAPAAGIAQPAVSRPAQLLDLYGPAGASVVAVEDGRVTAIGSSRKLGKYLTLRDVYGDVFTYADLGSIAPTYQLPKTLRSGVAASARVGAETARDAKPKLPASAGSHPAEAPRDTSPASTASTTAPAFSRKVRLFAHPDNPYARAAAARAALSARSGTLPLRRGSILAQGTLIGHLGEASAPQGASMRFAISPGGDAGTVDPLPILENWQQLGRSLHPQGAKGNGGLVGATANGVFLLTKSELERAVLSDPGISIYRCARQEIASGRVESHVLAALLFLSRNGLKPTVSGLRCGQSKFAASGVISAQYAGTAVDISAVNGTPIAGHQGAGTITDLTIRTLLTLHGHFAPAKIVSLMKYPGQSSAVALPDHARFIEIDFFPARPVTPAAVRIVPAGRARAAVRFAGGGLSPTQWQRLINRIGQLPAPKVQTKRSGAAIRDRRTSTGKTSVGVAGPRSTPPQG
jgi:soluble lytic murein transglycosylase-like protein